MGVGEAAFILGVTAATCVSGVAQLCRIICHQSEREFLVLCFESVIGIELVFVYF